MSGRKGDSVGSADEGVPSNDLVSHALDRILTSQTFAKSERLKRLLRYLTAETLAGRGSRLKEYTIGLEVFDRDPSFDPQTSAIVRVEVGRLRKRLEQYYLIEGVADSIRIQLPKGSYVPGFPPGIAADDPNGQKAEEGRPFERWWTMPRLAFSIAVFGLIVAAALIWSLHDREPDIAVALPSGPSIAVLPFTNMSTNADHDYLADGITDEILTDLARFKELFVLGRHTVFQYKGQPVDLRQVRRKFGVDYVLQGSVRRDDPQVRVTAQLLSTDSGAHLWTDSFDEDHSAKSVLNIQKDIARQVVATIGDRNGIISRVNLVAAADRSPDDLSAYDCFLKIYAYWLDESPEKHRDTRSCLERAVDDEPNYANAWAGLAVMYLDEFRLQFNPRMGASPPLDRALEAAKKAVHLDPSNGTAYHALFLTHFHRREFDQFRQASLRALELNPNNATIVADLGLYYGLMGHWERGMAMTTKAMTLNPTYPYWYHLIFFLDHYRKHEYSEALGLVDGLPAGYFWKPAMKAMIYGHLNAKAEAGQAVEQLAILKPDFAENFWTLMAAWNVSSELTGSAAAGLRKAGIILPPNPKSAGGTDS